jgi:hypothetical protein
MIMDLDAKASWKITVGNAPEVDGSLFTAYCKAKSLDRRAAGMWEV